MTDSGVVSTLLEDMRLSDGIDAKSIQDKINRLTPGVQPSDTLDEPLQQPQQSQQEQPLPPMDTISEDNYSYAPIQQTKRKTTPKKGMVDKICCMFKYFIAATIVFLLFNLPAVDSIMRLYINNAYTRIDTYRIALKSILAGLTFTLLKSTLL